MNSSTKQAIIAFSFLVIESIVFTGVLLATDKDVNGITNAFSLKYIWSFIAWGGIIFLGPLSLLYMFLKNKGFKSFFITLLLVGFCIAGLLSLLQRDAGGYNPLLYFVYRGVFFVGIFGSAILIPWVISKFTVADPVQIHSN